MFKSKNPAKSDELGNRKFPAPVLVYPHLELNEESGVI